MKALIISTLYIGALVIIFVRAWINKNLEVKKEKDFKQLKQLIIIIILIIIIESLIDIGFHIKEGNIQIPINVVLENKTTTAEKNQIKIKLKEMNEVISFDTEYGYKIVEEQLGNILDNLQTNINSLPECYRIIIHYKDKENVKQQLEELEGIKSLNFGL